MRDDERKKNKQTNNNKQNSIMNMHFGLDIEFMKRKQIKSKTNTIN